MKEKFTFVIFGASGDLTNKKLLPSLFKLYKKKVFEKSFNILAIGRRELNDIIYRDSIINNLWKKGFDKEEVKSFTKIINYYKLDIINENYFSLRDYLYANYERFNYVYYFAISPILYSKVAQKLFLANLTKEDDGFKRVIVEKPFGRDLDSAIKLNNELHEFFLEPQIFRIDHYLGKETVQNILVTRFANSFFEPIWNRNFIDFVEITSAESITVGTRAGYYDNAGALRDMVQNHLLQVLALIAMEAPISTDSKALRDEMVKVFQSLREIKKDEVSKYVVRGQYLESLYKGKSYKAYRDEEGIDNNSKTETYVAMKCYVDNWRWSGIPFYIKTGKALATSVVEVVIHFKANPHTLFKDKEEYIQDNNKLVIRIQPDAGIMASFQMKVPGAGFEVQPVNMDFHYNSLKNKEIPEAYERLLSDCVENDPTLFQRNDAIEVTWKFVQPILDAWSEDDNIPLYGYPARSWGPQYIENLLAEKSHHWRFPCANLSDGKYCEL